MKKITKNILLSLIFISIALLTFKYAEEIVQFKKNLYTYIADSKLEKAASKDFEQLYPSFTPFEHSQDAWYQNTNLIYHAGGGIDSLEYTNSKEAMESAVLSGNVIEVDFLHTNDGFLVCAHDWEKITDTNEVPSLSEFQCMKIYGKYTPLTAEDLVEFMSKHTDVYIVIDTKERNRVQVIQDLINIAKEPDIIERFIIQLYAEGMKQQILDIYPFSDENFLFTCYLHGENYKSVLNICMKENISVVTLPYNYWDADIIDMFTSKGIVLFEHTVNRLDHVLKSKEKGISKFYTDFMTEPVFVEE